MKNISNLLAGFKFAGVIFSLLYIAYSYYSSERKNADLSVLCNILKEAFEEYRSAAVSTYGVRKEEAVKDAAARLRVMKKPASQCNIFDTGLGQTLCYDSVYGRYFCSDIEKIKQAINRLNNRLSDGKTVNLNDLYRELRLPDLSDISQGGAIGWKPGKGAIDISYSSQLIDETPCFVLDYTRNLQPL